MSKKNRPNVASAVISEEAAKSEVELTPVETPVEPMAVAEPEMVEASGAVVNPEALDECEPITVPAEDPVVAINHHMEEINASPIEIKTQDHVEKLKDDVIAIELIPGKTVKIRQGTKKTYTGLDLPEFALRNTYKVEKVIGDRVIVKSGFYQTVVSKSDLVFAD